MYLIFAMLLALASSRVAFSTDLCKGSDWWYDIQSAKCHPCRVCDGKSFVMEPCSEFMNTLCVDLVEIGRSIDRSIEKGSKTDPKHPKWHETEAMDGRGGTDMPLATASVAKTIFEDFENQWGHIVMVILCITLFFISGSVVLLILKITGKRRCENRKNVVRARLFSRDRLNTTEYMNNLATLDRRLAMDEILEKRKKAIFEPHLLQENVYTDEVFVDISGLPRNLHDDHEYEDLDHRRCLLRMQDQQ